CKPVVVHGLAANHKDHRLAAPVAYLLRRRPVSAGDQLFHIRPAVVVQHKSDLLRRMPQDQAQKFADLISLIRFHCPFTNSPSPVAGSQPASSRPAASHRGTPASIRPALPLPSYTDLSTPACRWQGRDIPASTPWRISWCRRRSWDL